MVELKRLSTEAISAAVDKAVRYRLLNEPEQAESICLDVLAVEPDNQKALINLLLSLTDQLEHRMSEAAAQAEALVSRLDGAYSQAYYSGIISERRARAILQLDAPRCHYSAYEWCQSALTHYDKAIELRPPGNDDAILRWNTCVRMLERHPKMRPEPADRFHPLLE